MKKYITLLLVILSLSCNKETDITITKVSGSPEYVNAKLSLDDPIISEDGYEFSFNVDQYELGLQTLKDFEYSLANSAKGQHIHFIVNNDPYSAHYNQKFSKNNKNNDNKEKGRINNAKPMLRNKKVGTIKINPIIDSTSKKVFLLHDR